MYSEHMWRLLDSGHSNTELYSNGMFYVCLFDLATIFMPQNFVVFPFMGILFWCSYNSIRLLFCCFVEEDSAHDHSPLCRPHASGCSLRRNGRGHGIGRGRGCARVGFAAHPQDPPIQWSRNYVAPWERPFTEPLPGPTQGYLADCKEGTVFAEMFTNDMWELLVTETNRYHEQQVAAEPKKHKRKWSPVTRDEMEVFIGILIYMGIFKLPRIQMYWSTGNLIQQCSVSAIMTPHKGRLS